MKDGDGSLELNTSARPAKRRQVKEKPPIFVYESGSLNISVKGAYEKRAKALGTDEQRSAVEGIIDGVKRRGDAALFEYIEKYDGLRVGGSGLTASEEEISEAYKNADEGLIAALARCKRNILQYHERQLKGEEFDGKTGWRFVPIKRVGLYVPGGLAPYPSSVLMCALPAVAAGVSELVIATPNPSPLILAAAKMCGVKTVYKMGGAHAIAALAYGTKSVKKTDLIAGPGNIYVTLAKKAVFGDVGVDMLAGPSEIAIIADARANPDYIVADLISQAEHGPFGESVLVTPDKTLAIEVAKRLAKAAEASARKQMVLDSLRDNLQIVLTKDMKHAAKAADEIAPEHLEIMAADAYDISKSITNAGAIFLGPFAPVATGDYYAGPSHVLPTGGSARFSSVLSVDTFVRRVSLIAFDKRDLKKGSEDIIKIAETEGFFAHAESVKIRLNGESAD